jgi:transcription antitermination factor NusG
MPTLAAETSLFPELLLEPTSEPATDRKWWAVQTKARQEKSLARELLSYEIPFYLPLVRKYATRRGRKVCSHIPFFNGYVFLYADEAERVRSLTTNRISQLLPVVEQESLRRDLQQLQQLITSDAPLTFEQRLEPGQRVKIKDGLMRGVIGTLICRRNETRLLVAIDFLQQGASLEIDDFQLEPVEE